MSKQKRKVSLDDYVSCWNYFQRAIQNNRFMKNQDNILRAKATHAFSELNADASDEESVQPLQLWIDNFVDSATWGRCYRALNQKKYLVENNHRTITISNEAYEALKIVSGQKNLSLSQAILDVCAFRGLASRPPSTKNSVDENGKSSNAPLETSAITSLNIDQSKIIPPDSLVKPATEISSNVISLFGERLFESLDEDLDHAFDYDDFDEVPEWPRKPENYDFRKNESYKKYRKYIERLTIKTPDEKLLDYFSKTINYYLTEDNCHQIGPQLLSIRQDLLKQGLFTTEFNPDSFAISKGFNVSDLSMDGYADELLYLLGFIFGCTTKSITSGNREPEVFAGHPNHIQIAYKTYNYLDAFLKDEVERFSASCHKNTKRKNRRTKAKWHGNKLVSTMLNNIIDDEESYMLLPQTEYEKLSQHVYNKVHIYFDENEPIGGWWDPKKHPFEYR
jgi:hypothetical protein